jgi:hypothetical protein
LRDAFRSSQRQKHRNDGLCTGIQIVVLDTHEKLMNQLRKAALQAHQSLAIEFDEFDCIWRGSLQGGPSPILAFGLTQREVCEQLLHKLQTSLRRERLA